MFDRYRRLDNLELCVAIQALCRDASLRIAAERGITKPVYIIPINKISNHWLERYFRHKAKLLREAIATNTLPPICSVRERWGNRKCLDYCAARENCPHVRYISSDNVLKDLYKIINCDLVTCTQIQVNGKLFNVWSDDEALLKDKPTPNLYINDDLIIFGSVAFAKSDEDGKLVGLTRDEVHLL